MSDTMKAMLGIGLRHAINGSGAVAVATGVASGDLKTAGAGLIGILISLGLSYVNKKALGGITQ